MDPFNAKLVAAAAGSSLTALTMTPFDVVKTRLQTQPPNLLFPRPPQNVCCQPVNAANCVRRMSSLAPSLKADVVCLWDRGVFRTERVNGFYDAVRHVWAAEGARGLWKGVGTTMLIAVPSQTSYMLTYDHLLNVTLPPLIPSPYLVPLFSGILARATVTTVVSPLELIRTNLQATPLSPNQPQTLRSVLSAVRSLIRDNGPRSLWRGLGPTLWRDVPFSGIYWASYERCKRVLQQPGRSVAFVAFISGAISGTFSALLTSPFDVLKTRRQALLMSSQPRMMGTVRLLLRIVRTEGYSALFAGLKPRIAKIAPACGIMITCFEGVGGFLSKKESSL